MTGEWIYWGVAGLVVVLGVAAVWRKRRSLASWLFLAGMVGLAVVTVFDGLAAGAPEAGGRAGWVSARLVASAALPGIWLAFSLVYSRGNYRAFLRAWGVWLGAAFVVPLVIVAVFGDALVATTPYQFEGEPIIYYGEAARWLHLCLLATAVMVLVNIERTFRAAVGTMRWRVKFLVLGLGVLFGARIYTLSQSLLFSGHDPGMAAFDAASLLVASALIGIAYLRSGFAELDVHPSHQILQSSITVVVAGGYLLVVGVLAQFIAQLGGIGSFQTQALVVLVGIVGLAVLLLSDRFRVHLRRFVSRHFRRPQHDFRQVWTLFTRRVSNVFDRADLCREVAKLVAETFNVLTVRILLFDPQTGRAQVVASTFASGPDPPAPRPSRPGASTLDPPALDPSRPGASTLDPSRPGASTPDPGPDGIPLAPVLDGLAGLHDPFALDRIDAPWAESVRGLCPTEFPHGGERLGVPIAAADRTIGLAVLADRVDGLAYTEEERELLICIGDQAAAALLNLRLADELGAARELEAFQAMSTFFVHDLKNAASSLNLMLRNLPVHFDDPEFRQDALRGIGKTADRINGMIARLSALRGKLELKLATTDLTALVAETVADLAPQPAGTAGTAGAPDLQLDLAPTPPLLADAEHLRSVITNLVLNAREAVAEATAVAPRSNPDHESARSPAVRIATDTDPATGNARLTVADDGAGMTPEFLRDGLFKPFQSTKSNGLGIGMFQSKAIIDAHDGKIHVESTPGEGTTFVITIPAADLRKPPRR